MVSFGFSIRPYNYLGSRCFPEIFKRFIRAILMSKKWLIIGKALLVISQKLENGFFEDVDQDAGDVAQECEPAEFLEIPAEADFFKTHGDDSGGRADDHD